MFVGDERKRNAAFCDVPKRDARALADRRVSAQSRGAFALFETPRESLRAPCLSSVQSRRHALRHYLAIARHEIPLQLRNGFRSVPPFSRDEFAWLVHHSLPDFAYV